jgi:hypothetical protein
MSEDLRATQELRGTTVFLDADVFLHYPPLNELPWDELCPGVRTVAVCLTVVGQIDIKKNDARLRERALRAVSDIRRFRSQGQVREGLPFRVYHDSVHDDDVLAPLNPSSSDDRILTAVLQAGRDNPLCEPLFMSGDYVVEIKCESLGIPFVSLDRVTRLPPPADEHTKKLKALEEQVRTLQARIPDLHFEAECLGRLVCTPLAKPYPSRPEEVEKWLEDVVAKELEDATGGPGQLNDMEPSRRAHWEKYIGRFRDHCSVRAKVAEICQRTFVCRLYLSNMGTIPATHVDALITFPSKVCLVDKTSDQGRLLAGPHDPPERPVPSDPYSLSDFFKPPQVASVMESLGIRQRGERVPEHDVIRDTNAGGADKVAIRLGRLQQEERVECCEVLVVFRPGEEITPLEIACSLTASEVPYAVSRKTGLLITTTMTDRAEGPT